MKKIRNILNCGYDTAAVTALASIFLLAGCSGDKSSDADITAENNIEELAPAVETATDPAHEATALIAMMKRHGHAVLASSPETATRLGVSESIAGEGFQSRLSSYGFEAGQVALTNNEEFLIELAGINRDVLPADMIVTYDILQNAYETGARRNQFNFGGTQYWGSNSPYRITQLSGLHLSLPRLLQNEQPLSSAQDVEAYLSRLSAMSNALDEVGQMVRADSDLGVVPPVFALQGASSSMRNFTSSAPEDNPLVTTFGRKISEIDDVDADALRAWQLRAAEIVRDEVYPAYSRLEETLTGLIPLSIEGDGIWRLGAQGEEFYQHALDSYGAQGRDGEEIHELGLAEVARISTEMDAILKGEGYETGSVAERMDAIGKRAENQYSNDDNGRGELLNELKMQVAEIMDKSGDWFGTLPAQPVEVRRIPVYEQDTSPGGYYTGPSLDGTRPGIYWINLKDTADWPKMSLKTLTYHEAVPGHHFQISLQRAIPDLPLVRNMMGYSEFSEGWALYSEQVAEEMGMYEGDPLGNLGRLQSELFRAARLVVDSGIHHKRWNRAEAIDYMVDVTGNTRASMTREVERYIVWPGQATSYKLGMLKIGELRKRAELELGEAFSVKDFHDEVLLTGSMPLPVLEAKIDRWIAATKGA